MASFKTKRGRPRSIDVQVLRRKLLDTCMRYLDETPLQELSAAMVKATAEVVTTVGHEFSKEERSKQGGATSNLLLPFPVPEDSDRDSGIPLPIAATAEHGFPHVPIPSATTSGGIKAAPPGPRTVDEDYSGLCRKED